MLEQAARPAVWPRLERPRLDPALLRQLMSALLAAALAETFFLRLATRVGVHMPKEGAVSAGFQLASFLGSLAFNFAAILATGLAVVLLAVLVLRQVNAAARLLLAALAGSMFLGLASSLLAGSDEANALFGVSATLTVGLVGLALLRREGASPQARLALALIVGAYFSYQYYALGHLFYRLLEYSAAPPLGVAALRLGEGLVVAAGAAVFCAWGLDRWRQIGRGGIAFVTLVLLVVAAGSLSPVSTTSILALWTNGLSLFLPLPLYLVALGLYLATLIACWRSGDASFGVGTGLLLLLLAGYMPESTYQHLLVLLGVVSLSDVGGWAEPAA